MTPFRYCPRCGKELANVPRAGRERLACPDDSCGYVCWDNPLPVVAALVEHEGVVLLARNKGWPEGFFGLVTGFLERDETPEEGVLREVKEELGLSGRVQGLIGAYAFQMRNELIVAYHVIAEGTVQLGEELEAVKRIPPEKLRPWPFATGQAVADWLKARKSN
jgi:NADH pyrophosphatase NudC (nudix superfamily)